MEPKLHFVFFLVLTLPQPSLLRYQLKFRLCFSILTKAKAAAEITMVGKAVLPVVSIAGNSRAGKCQGTQCESNEGFHDDSFLAIKLPD